MSADSFEEQATDARSADLQEMLADSDEVDEMLDTSYSPPDHRPRATFEHESLDERLAEETPEVWAGVSQDGEGGGDSEEGEPYDQEVGRLRSGRLLAPDEGAHADRESEVYARDVGFDGGAATAEEAAMHVIVDDEDDLYED